MGDHYHHGNHYGDNVRQSGDNNVYVKPTYHAPTPAATREELIRAIRDLQYQVGPDDRSLLEQALPAIARSDPASDGGAFKRAVTAVAGVAALVGQAGMPVMDLIQKAKQVFAL